MPKDPQQDLMILAVEDGLEYVLDLNSGRQWHALPAPLRSMRRVAERAVNRDRLEAILRAAAIPCERDGDGDVVANLYGERVTLLVNAERRFVRFLGVVTLQQFVTDETVNAALRQLNNDYDVLRFRCAREGYVSAEYVMSYQYGISPQQLVEMLQGFTWTMQQAFHSETFFEESP